MSVKRWLSQVLFLSLGVSSAASCGSTTQSKGCTAGTSAACAGPGGCQGFQLCAADGASYGACNCGALDGGYDFPSSGDHSGLLGATCSSVADCRLGLSCLTSGSTAIQGEGPSAGLCVISCAGNHAGCTASEPNSTCVVLDDNGTPSVPDDDAAFCLPTCKLGPAVASDDKCRSRVDLVCSETATGAGAGYCRPACRNDVDCAPRVCDLKTGLCGDTAGVGQPIGAACDPQNPDCADGCISHGATYAECSGVCSFGTPGCGQTQSSPPFDFYCDLDPSTNSGPGDLGYCSKLCDCDGDCGRPDAVCQPETALTAKTGRAGVCGSKTYASGGPRPNLPCK
jgi:hypothetical protein